MTARGACLRLHIPGVPVPQGSLTYMRGNYVQDDRLYAWREKARLHALAHINLLAQPWDTTGPFRIRVSFHFPRPESHYHHRKEGRAIKTTAPPHHTTTPDLDKLIRAIGDAGKDILWKDDRVITSIIATKAWAVRDAGADLTVIAL